MSDDQELIPIEQHTEDGEPLIQSRLEEAEATSERALVPLQVSQVDFYGDGLTVVLVEIGGERQVLVPPRQFCQYLGVDWTSQYQRTKRDEIRAREMADVVVITTAGPGQRVFAAAASGDLLAVGSPACLAGCLTSVRIREKSILWMTKKTESGLTSLDWKQMRQPINKHWYPQLCAR